MAAALIRRLVWPVLAVGAFAFLVGLALHGGRPDLMVQYKPAGLLTAFTPQEAIEVRITTVGGTQRFRREGGKWSGPPNVGERIDVALRLLRDSAPLRVLVADEVAQAADAEYAFGKDNLRVEISVGDGRTFVIQFGGMNPLGSARYVRVEGMAGVPLLPTYVAEAWEKVVQ